VHTLFGHQRAEHDLVRLEFQMGLGHVACHRRLLLRLV
jgi:hypothetical protein